MSNVIFALPRTQYDSYRDLYTLITVNGYPTVYIDEVDPASDNCYIMTVANGENEAGFDNPRARIILWDFEHRVDTYPRIPGCEYWHMDAAQARQHDVRYVPLGGDARLNPRPDADGDPLYDIAYMAYFTHRREHIRVQLAERGIRLAGNAWGTERHDRLTRSRAYLHVHQLDNAPAVPALRMVVASAYRLPVITEAFSDPGIFDGLTLEAEYDDLALAAATWSRGYWRMLADYADALHNVLCNQFTFRVGIEGHV